MPTVRPFHNDDPNTSVHCEFVEINQAGESEQTMRLNEILVNQLGVREDVSLNEIANLTVIHGGNGSGKTTLVRFVRDTFVSADSLTTHRPNEASVGSMQVSDSRHRWTL